MNFHSRRRQHHEKFCRPDGVTDVGTNCALSGECLVGNSWLNSQWCMAWLTVFMTGEEFTFIRCQTFRCDLKDLLVIWGMEISTYKLVKGYGFFPSGFFFPICLVWGDSRCGYVRWSPMFIFARSSGKGRSQISFKSLMSYCWLGKTSVQHYSHAHALAQILTRQESGMIVYGSRSVMYCICMHYNS